jgi:superfamily I DNA/RNA helicase
MVVVTFTNAAANQLVERVQKRLNVETPPSFAYIGTLHGYCLRIVRKHGSSFGFGTALAVAGDEAANDILDAEVKRKKYNGSAKDLTLAVRKFARLDLGLRPSTKAELVAAAYHRAMRQNGLLDFDTLLKIALAVIEANPTIGGTDLMVDEMQDSGDDDAAIYDALSFKRKFYVGDPHQSIYGFRGGSPKHMERLIQEHSYCPIATNFRSVPEIVTAAYRLIQHNPSPGYAMEMQPHREPLGAEAPSLKYVEYRGELDEMMGVAKAIEGALSLGIEPKHIAVLVRTNAVAAEFRKCMEGYGIHSKREDSGLQLDGTL